MSSGTLRYLAMEREFYADLVARSDYSDERFTEQDSAELIVGSYAQHERFDYERWLCGGLAIYPGAVALEFGCGPGRMLRRMAPHFSRVDGVDISPDVLDVAHRRCAELANRPRLWAIDGQHLPRELASAYDVAFSVICLQHIAVHSVRRRIFAELFRALKPGGVLTFQMGYGPGHAAMVDYYADYVDAAGTNGEADVTVLHPGEIGEDLKQAGFGPMAYALTPTGPGDTHGAWIFVRTMKPGPVRARVSTSPAGWSAVGFEPLELDTDALWDARRRQLEHGTLARFRSRTQELQAAEARVAVAEAHVTAANVGRQQDLEVRNAQLARLQALDAPRLHALMSDLATWAGDTRHVAILGSGAQTEWLLGETPLGLLGHLSIIDNNPAAVGRLVGGLPVKGGHELAQLAPDAVVLTSLSHQNEMAAFVEGLSLAGTRLVRCY